MKLIISPEFVDESLGDKARWFATLSVEERIAWLDEWTEIILQNNPAVFNKFNDDSSFQGTVRVLRKTQS
jgi:hypothetical protein